MAEEKIFSDEEVVVIKNIMQDCLKSYAAKDKAVSNKQWLKDLLLEKIKSISEERAAEDAETIVQTVNSFSESIQAMQQAEQQGISNESWMAKTVQDDIENNQPAANAEEIEQFDDALYLKNVEMTGEAADSMLQTGEGSTEAEEEESKECSPQQLKEIVLNIGKNAKTYGIQNAASTAGTMLVSKIMDKEDIPANKIIQEALKSGVDTSLHVVTSGALKVASANQLLESLPESTPTSVIANLSSAGIEGVKILRRITAGEISISKGIEQYGRLGVALVKNIWAAAKKTSIKDVIRNFIPFMGAKFAAISETVGMVCAFLGGTNFGKKIAETKTRVASAAKVVAKTAMQGLRRAKEYVRSGLQKAKNVLRKIFS